MAFCELCGKIVDSTTTVKVAGTLVSSCSNCKGLGASVDIGGIDKTLKTFRPRNKTQEVLEVVPNYTNLLNSSLGKKDINLHQLAHVLNIKESSLNKYFSGKIQPNIEMARKLENYLSIKLVVIVETKSVNVGDFMNNDSASDSLGDMLIKELEKQNKK